MHRTMLCLALLTTPAMAQERYVFTQYRAGGAPPHFIATFETRPACDEMRSRAMRETEAALTSARQTLEQARRSAPDGAEARVRSLEAERNNLQAAVRGSRRERLVQNRLTEVDRELESLRSATETLRAADSEAERLAQREQALRESSICERR